MPGFGTLDWSNWLYGLFSGFIGGGSNAVVAGITVSTVDPHDFAIGSKKFFIIVVTTFVFNGMLSMFLFLKQQPLPPMKTVVTKVETTEKQADPPAVVKTTVEETRVEPIKEEK